MDVASRVSSARLVGRAGELAELRAALTAAQDGAPVMAFVAGESGVGKTRLAAELEAEALAAGVRVLRGECVELGEGELAYAPLTAALRPLVRAGDPAFAGLSPGAREALPSLLPGLGEAGRRRTTASEAEGARAQVFEALLELVDALGAEHGLLLVVEDLHWADSSTRAFLRFLGAALHHERLLVVGTYRADELHRRHPLRPLLAELERLPCARRLELHRLTREELAEQLADIAGAVPERALLDRLWARSEGNPLFAEELLAAGTDGRGALPPTLRDALMLRIERLSSAAQEIVRVLAAGMRLPHDILAAVAGADPVVLREGLREAVSAQILTVDGEGRFLFRHALLREVVLDDLLPGERADAHARLARAIEASQTTCEDDLVAVANHYAAAGDRPAALRTAVAAGQASEDAHAYEEAASHYERALELWDLVPDAEGLAGVGRVEVLRAAAYCRRTTNEPGRAVALLRSAAAEVDAQADPLLAAAVLERLAAAQWTQGRIEESDLTRAQAHELLGPAGEPRGERARLLATESKQLMLIGRYRESAAVARRALEEARATGETLALVTAQDALGVSLAAIGAHDEGLDMLRDAVELSRREGMPTTMFTAFTNLADAATIAGRLPLGREVAAEAQREARAIGHQNHWLDLLVAELALLAGDWPAAQDALPERARPSMTNTYLNDTQRRADLALGLGRHDEARALLDEVRGPIADSRQPQFIAAHAAALAELERRLGDLEAARHAVDEGLDRIEFCSEDRARVAMVAATGVRVEADAALRARDLADAEAEALAVTRAHDLSARVQAIAADEQPVERARALVSRAALLRATGADAPLTWERAAAAWDALDWRYDAALARFAAAEAALAGGDRDTAARLAAAVRDAAAQMGTAWLQAEVAGLATRARLRLDATDAGAATGPASADGTPADPFGLTARERQVLALVAAGRTNREIGGELFMAEKTASVHVSRILAKLEVRSRTEAAGVAHRLGLA